MFKKKLTIDYIYIYIYKRVRTILICHLAEKFDSDQVCYSPFKMVGTISYEAHDNQTGEILNFC